MATITIPRIRQEHYKAFLALPTANLPDTFDEWLKDRSLEERENLRSGLTIEPIEIYAEEFAAFCRKADLPMDLYAIKRWAVEKPRGNLDAEGKLSPANPRERPNKIIESTEP